ncbi:tetratricopeptide repeat protein [Kingella oralis]|jgi:putative cysteine-rich protein X|uniref:tetratricopeptide repeat protein n=1 Tax=Kingella oralis TaxID=505 RepID=UPI0034E52737
MNETKQDKNRDKKALSELKEVDLHSNIKDIKKKKSWTWNGIAKKLYYFLQENSDSPLPAAYEEQEIKKFEARFKKTINEKRQSCELVDGKKFSISHYWEEMQKWEEVQEILKKNLPASEDDELNEKDFNDFNERIIDGLYSVANYQNIDEKIDKAIEYAKRYYFIHTLLGHFYFYYGLNKIPNIRKAVEHYKLAAEQGAKLAAYQLGRIYECGRDEIDKNESIAFKYYQQSANKDFPLALNKLAYFYFKGIHVKKNNELFFEMANKSAQQKNPIGLLHLAFAYENGIGTGKSSDRAVEIYEKFVDLPLNIWSQPICLKLADVYKMQGNERIARQYLEKAKKFHAESLEIAWEENELLAFFYDLIECHPDKINEISRGTHFDDANRSYKPTETLKAIFS